MSEEAVLTYFEGRGLGEIIRLTLSVAKIPFKQNFVHTSEDLQNLIADGKLLFNQLPLLEIDGLNLTQSTAIVRYIGDRGGLVPKDPNDKYRAKSMKLGYTLSVNKITDACENYVADEAMYIIQFKVVDVKVREDFTKLETDGKLLFGQVPLLEIDGLKIVQSNAIVRYVADKAGFIAADITDRARMDTLYFGTRDLNLHYTLELGLEGKAEEPRKKITTKVLPRYLPIFNKALADNGGSYIVGNSLTLADLGLFESLMNVEDYFGAEHLDDYPLLMEFLKKMKSTEEGQIFINKYKKNINDEKLMEECKVVLPHIYQ